MKRTYLIFVIALITLLGSIVAVLSTLQMRDFMLRGYVDPTTTADLPFRVPLLGVNAELTQYSTDELRHQFALMQQAHVTWVRQFVRWDEIESQQGQFNWEMWDNIVAALQDYPDLDIVVVLVNSPAWARTRNESDTPTAPPDDPSTFAHFASLFAARYGQTIDHYQIWDEPNLTAAWGNRQPRAVDYAVLLQAAYAAIHAADSGAAVIAAALAPTTEHGPDNISDIRYLHDLYAFGASAYMDAVAAKPYGFDLPPTDRTVDEDILNFSRIIALREEMVRNGDAHKALWGCAGGWNSLPDTWAGQPSIWGDVTQDQQTQFTFSALQRAEREWPWMGGLILQQWQPDAPTSDPVWGFALLDSRGNPTPLWTALSQRTIATSAQNGLFPATTAYASYSGVWTFSTLGADIGWIRPTDSQLEFQFEGTNVALLLRQDNYVAYLYPTIDGQAANATPHDPDGTAYIVLTSDSTLPETTLVPVGQNLGDGTHTLRVVADRGEDRWALAGYAVSSGDPSVPYNNEIAIGLFTMMAATVAAVVTGWQIDWHLTFKPLNRLWTTLSNTGQWLFSLLTSLALMIGMLLTWGDTLPSLFRRDEIPIALVIASAGLLRLELHVILTITALLVLFFIIYNRLDLGVTLAVFWAPFFLFPVELYRFAFPIAEMVILLTGVAWVLRGLASWGRSRQSANSRFPLSLRAQAAKHLRAMDYAVLAWAVLGIISILWAARQKEAITELRTMIAEPVLLYFMLRQQIRDRQSLLRLVDVLLLAGFIVSVVGLFLYFSGQAIITAEEGARRLASVYGSPNNVGLFLGRCVPFALAFLIIGSPRRTKNKPTSLSFVFRLGVRRVLAGICLLTMLIAIALTQSAGAIFIGVPLALAAVLLAVWGKRAWYLIGGLAGAGALALPVLLQSERFARVLDFTQGTNFYRIRVWQSALNIIRDHPITGLGLDQFLYAFRGEYILPDAWQEPNLSHPHNFLLDAWVRLGILGVLVFIWIQVLFWRQAKALYSRFKGKDYILFGMTVGVLGSMVNLLAHGLVDNSVYVQDLAIVYVLLLGLSTQLSMMEPIDDNNEMMV